MLATGAALMGGKKSIAGVLVSVVVEMGAVWLLLTMGQELGQLKVRVVSRMAICHCCHAGQSLLARTVPHQLYGLAAALGVFALVLVNVP